MKMKKKIDKTSPKRWKIAQQSEKEYWKGFNTEQLLREESERHKIKAQVLEKEWQRFIPIKKNTKILQIGCGPEDMINYFSKGDLYAIDPLAEFYKKKFKLDYNNLTFLEARGEKIPFKDNEFDIVILANVLDHMEDPKKHFSKSKEF
jgi:ubiquinone/menaquinone biosynthesis C-methylase UbiE